MANFVIVGAGAAGLYTAYRLLKTGVVTAGSTLNVYEWARRPGGRIYTYTFPPAVGGSNGLYAEFGGMRFATDPNFPKSIIEGHVLVQQMIYDLGLDKKVVPFLQSDNRLYYLRGDNVYENSLNSINGLPYGFNAEFKKFLTSVNGLYTADNILGRIAEVFAPKLGSKNVYRADWCKYYASGTVDAGGATTSFPKGTPVRDIGYWNLLYDQLGDEGFDYAADGTGYESNVINWNSADAMQANNDYGSTSKYSRLDGGFSLLFKTLADRIAGYPNAAIHYGWSLQSLAESKNGYSTDCTFFNGANPVTVKADFLFLAMPRRALELVAQGGYYPGLSGMKYYLESSLDQPAMKVVMVFDQAWWREGGPCKYPPILVPQSAPPSQRVGGATITDLPLRMIYYFGNNIPGGPGMNGGPYVLLATYDDMNYTNFWREVEINGDYTKAPSLMYQPLHGPTPVHPDSPMGGLLLKQLADVHGIDVGAIPTPKAIYYQDWGQDPFGAGYHGWSSHYNICDVMDKIRAPYQKVLRGTRRTYIVGSCYSFDQAWVEGAFCTAESVLQEFLGLPPFGNIKDYRLICKASD